MSRSSLATEVQVNRQHFWADFLLPGVGPQHQRYESTNNPMSHFVPHIELIGYMN